MPSERSRPMGDDSGAVAVETALVSMLLIILIFGIVETSLLFKDWLSVSAAARAGARMGSSEPRVATFAQDSADQVTNGLAGLNPANIQQVWVYKTTGATGSPPVNCDMASQCVPFSWNASSSRLTTAFSNNWAASAQNACTADVVGPAPNLRDSLGVYIQYKHSGMGFFFNNAIVSESTVMWIEPLNDVLCKPPP
jgi:Flp pilus assembly protein TadG